MVVAGDSLKRVVDAARADPGVGMLGPMLLYFDDPQRVQALGGARFSTWFVTGWPVGWNKRLQAGQPIPAARRLDYIAGAAMYVTRACLERIGPMPEQFFLYFEEIAWALAARPHFTLRHVPGAIVYHREGPSTGLGRGASMANPENDFVLNRNRLRFARIYYPRRIAFAYLGLLFAAIEALVRGEWRRLPMFFRPSLWTWPAAIPATAPSSASLSNLPGSAALPVTGSRASSPYNDSRNRIVGKEHLCGAAQGQDR